MSFLSTSIYFDTHKGFHVRAESLKADMQPDDLPYALCSLLEKTINVPILDQLYKQVHALVHKTVTLQSLPRQTFKTTANASSNHMHFELENVIGDEAHHLHAGRLSLLLSNESHDKNIKTKALMLKVSLHGQYSTAHIEMLCVPSAEVNFNRNIILPRDEMQIYLHKPRAGKKYLRRFATQRLDIKPNMSYRDLRCASKMQHNAVFQSLVHLDKPFVQADLFLNTDHGIQVWLSQLPNSKVCCASVLLQANCMRAT